MKRLNFTPLALILIASTNAMAAQDAKSLLIDAGPCLGFQVAAEKLACFEKQVKDAQGPGVASSQADKAATTANVSSQNPPTVTSPKPEEAKRASIGIRGNSQDSGPEIRIATSDRTSTAENFGLKEKAEIKKSGDAENELTSTIASIKEIMPNKYRITLQNGQVWRQMNAQRYALAAGQEVRIYANPWGHSYRLAVKKLGSFIEVERIE